MSPWWWVALAVLLGAGEMLTTTTLLLWSALGALATAAVVWLLGPAAWPLELGIFAVLSVAITLVGREITRRRQSRPDAATPLNRRAAQLVGREAEVISFHHGEGRVTVDGIPWQARIEGGLPAPTPGERLRIVATDGIVVIVRHL